MAEGGSGNVEVTVRSQLLKIAQDLEVIAKASEKVQNGLKGSAEDVGKAVNDSTRKVQSGMDKLQSFGRRLADSLRKDFSSLAGINALAGSLKLSEQFKGSIKETVNLSDTIRKLGSTFGIAGKDFASFQSRMTKGLGAIGLSSDDAANALQGLADTPVRGEKNLIGYAKAAGELASIGNEKGSEGKIANGLARVVKGSGGDPNNMGAVGSVSEDIRRARNATGKSPSEILAAMQQLLTKMPEEMRKTVGTRGLTNLAAISQVAGANSTQFLEEFMSKSSVARKALEAQGFKGVFNKNGLDVDKFGKASKSILGRVGEDPRLAAQTLGISEEAADGFIRLAKSLDKVRSAQDAIAGSTGDLDEQYRSSMGLGEAFRANINKVKGVFAGPLAGITQGVTDVLSKASGSGVGAAAVVGGGGLLAALLAGTGLKGIAGGLGMGGIAKAGAVEGLTGRQVQPVYVTNASEMGGIGKGAMGGAATLGLVGAAAAVTAGLVANQQARIIAEVDPAKQKNMIEAGDKGTGNGASNGGNALAQSLINWLRGQKVEVALKSPELKAASRPSRGAIQ